MKNVANATNYLDIDTKELFRIYSKDKDNKDAVSYTHLTLPTTERV